MIFRQLFDSVSGTYTYLIASRHGGEALVIDPVLEKVDRYLQLVRELELKLVKAVDTHLHADHVTGLGALRARNTTRSSASCLSCRTRRSSIRRTTTKATRFRLSARRSSSTRGSRSDRSTNMSTS